MTTITVLRGRFVHVVEDEYLVAADLARSLERGGATVVGPARDVRQALELLASGARVDGAILDIRLRGEDVFAVADALLARAIPFLFASGFGRDIVPNRHQAAPFCEKPLDVARAAEALFGVSAGATT
jgi:CheY-like chemotaxis protein